MWDWGRLEKKDIATACPVVFGMARGKGIIIVEIPSKVEQMPAQRKGVRCVELKEGFHSTEQSLEPHLRRLNLEARTPWLHSLLPILG